MDARPLPRPRAAHLALVALLAMIGALVVAPVASGQATRSTERIAGADRFETAALIAERAFPTGAEVVYLARADEPADALAAGSLSDGPLLLVPSCGDVPASVLAAVDAIDPATVVALGGTGAICDAVLTQVAGDAPPSEEAPAEPAPADPAVIDVRASSPNEPRPGTYAVADAGTVTVDLTDAGLVLVDATAADGWTAVIDEQTPSEIDVDFRTAGREASFEVEVEAGILEIEIDDETAPAEPGVIALGPAGTATLALDGGRVVLQDLQVADGWTVVERDEGVDDVEVELRAGQERWELDADVEAGVLEIEVDYELEGPPVS